MRQALPQQLLQLHRRADVVVDVAGEIGRDLLDVPYVHVVFTLREVAADPRHLGAEIGVLSILHTWGQTLVRLPVTALSRVFRGKYVEALRRAYARDELDRAGGSEHLRAPAQCTPSSTPSSTPTGSCMRNRPSGAPAPSSDTSGAIPIGWRSAIIGRSPSDGEHVTFQWKDYAHDRRRTMTLTAMESLRRFVQHILPRGFVRIRQSGFLANT